MKSILMAAVMTVSVLAGSAHAIIDGGCIPPKGPKKPRPAPEAAARPRNNCPSGNCVAAVRG